MGYSYRHQIHHGRNQNMTVTNSLKYNNRWWMVVGCRITPVYMCASARDDRYDVRYRRYNDTLIRKIHHHPPPSYYPIENTELFEKKSTTKSTTIHHHPPPLPRIHHSMTIDLLSRVRLTDAAKARNFDHRLDAQQGTVYDAGDGWAEVAWERRCSWHKAEDLEPVRA